MNQALTPRELRDLLAFLATLKSEPTTAGGMQAAAYAGPKIVNPAKDISHVFLLPVVLLGIGVSLALILLGTILSGGAKA